MGWMSLTRMFLLPHKLLYFFQRKIINSFLSFRDAQQKKWVNLPLVKSTCLTDPCAIVPRSVWCVSDSAGALFWPVGWTLTPNCPLVMSPLSTWLCYRCGTNPNIIIFTFQKLSFLSSTPSFLSPLSFPLPSLLSHLSSPPPFPSSFSFPPSLFPSLSPPLPPLPPFPFLPFLLLGWCSVQCSTIWDVNW